MYSQLYSCRKGPTKIPLGKDTPQGNMKLFHAKMKVNTYTVCEIGLFTEEDVGQMADFIVTVYLPHLRVLSCLETLVGHVVFLKGLIAATLESSEPLHC